MNFQKLITDLIVSNYFLANHSNLDLGEEELLIGSLAA